MKKTAQKDTNQALDQKELKIGFEHMCMAKTLAEKYEENKGDFETIERDGPGDKT